jgi:hypothetical protein
MIGVVIGLIIVCVILGFVFWAFQQLLPMIPLSEPFRTILRILVVLLVVVIVIWFMIQILGMAGIHVPLFYDR